jgi:hypothetical protein
MISPSRFQLSSLPDPVLIGNIRSLINTALLGKNDVYSIILVKPIFESLPEDLFLLEK